MVIIFSHLFQTEVPMRWTLPTDVPAHRVPPKSVAKNERELDSSYDCGEIFGKGGKIKDILVCI